VQGIIEQMNWHEDWRLLEKYLVLISIDAITRLVSLRRTLLVAVGVTIPNNAMEKL
jgi:hypothetical protein